MTPEDVLLETIAAVIHIGDGNGLRARQCRKLRESIEHEKSKDDQKPS